MMDSCRTPEFAIVGHPNEGKSSVLSTLSEDDSVKVSPIPGETRECRRFPVTIDGREVISLVDTPGFQNPRKTLAWMRAFDGDERIMTREFIRAHESDRNFHDDCALLGPVARGAGIIFVVDGSRPLRNIDRVEMEILRLTGRPRMAIINCKEDEQGHLEEWLHEFRKHFNSVRLFNSNHATYGDRIALFESLKAIDQELEKVIGEVITALEADWLHRNEQAARIVIAMLKECLAHRKTAPCPEDADEERVKKRLFAEYRTFVSRRERQAHKQIRRLFRHNLFDLALPEQSILGEDLFSDRTWEFLGLDLKQLVVAGGLGGAALAGGLDLVAGGASLGLFAILGGAAGAAGAALKGKELLSGARFLGARLDRQELEVGPVANIQLLYILLDRALIYYSHIVNRAHGRRDYPDNSILPPSACEARHGFTQGWNRETLKQCHRFFKAIRDNDTGDLAVAEEAMTDLVKGKMLEISKAEQKRRK